MERFNKYKHLEKHKSDWRFNWKNNMFKKSLPSVVWENGFLSNFLNAIELILIKGFSTSSNISKYFRF